MANTAGAVIDHVAYDKLRPCHGASRIHPLGTGSGSHGRELDAGEQACSTIGRYYDMAARAVQTQKTRSGSRAVMPASFATLRTTRCNAVDPSGLEDSGRA